MEDFKNSTIFRISILNQGFDFHPKNTQHATLSTITRNPIHDHSEINSEINSEIVQHATLSTITVIFRISILNQEKYQQEDVDAAGDGNPSEQGSSILA